MPVRFFLGNLGRVLRGTGLSCKGFLETTSCWLGCGGRGFLGGGWLGFLLVFLDSSTRPFLVGLFLYKALFVSVSGLLDPPL